MKQEFENSCCTEQVPLLQESIKPERKPTSLAKEHKKKVLIIAGPTGVGKTSLSLALGRSVSSEIVSADSVQVYRGMDIGTAKVSKSQRELIPHHLIDIRDVSESFNVCMFFEEAKLACHDILVRGKIPIVVGGTGFYIRSLLEGPPNGPPSDPNIRELLTEQLHKCGVELLYEKLIELDPLYATTITQNDAHKIIRALEIIELSGKKVSDFAKKEKTEVSQWDFRPWFVYFPKEVLYPRLDLRSEEMIARGLLEEVMELDRQGIRKNSIASQAIGYKQSLEFLDGAKTLEDFQKFKNSLKIASRHYAKRQFTWFKKEPSFRWVDLTKHTPEEIIEIILGDLEKDTPEFLQEEFS